MVAVVAVVAAATAVKRWLRSAPRVSRPTAARVAAGPSARLLIVATGRAAHAAAHVGAEGVRASESRRAVRRI